MHHCAHHKNCIDDAVAKADDICANKGLRFTELRRKVLNMIWRNHGPAKAYDIIDNIKGDETSAKPPTVYRTLDFLQENGFVHKLNSLNAYVGCSHPLKHSECYFLICNKCKEIKECCNADITKAIVKTSNDNKFKLKHITLEIEGECEDCSKKSVK